MKPMEEAMWAPYMHWAKTRPHPSFDLAGSNLVPCSVDDLPGARDALEINGPNDNCYAPLLELIAARYATSVDRVVTAPGASGANFMAMAALVRPGDEVLIERPAYDPLAGAARLLGARVATFERVYEDGFALDPDRISNELSPATRLVVVTDPHNPSGVTTPADVLDEIGRRVESTGAWVLVDEVYLDAVYGAAREPAANRSDRFVSTSSLTKSYGLAGLRCGWVLAAPAVTEKVARVRDVIDGTGSFPSDRLACVAFDNLDALEQRARGILEPNLARLTELIESRSDLEWVAPAGGNVSFPRLREGADSSGLVDLLLARYETAVVPGSFFECPDHFRVAFGCAPEVMREGLARIAQALDELGPGGRLSLRTRQ